MWSLKYCGRSSPRSRRSLSFACAMSRATIIGPESERRVFTGYFESVSRISFIGRERSIFKTSPPARAKDFYEAFFRAISRLEHEATKCIIALPARFGTGLPQRAKAIGRAWRRIGKAFPELEIWLVDTAASTIKRTTWVGWIES